MYKRVTLTVLVVLLAVSPAVAGVRFTAVTRSEGGQGAEQGDMVVRAWASGGNAKFEFADSGNPIMQKGTYLVTHDGGESIYLVNPKEQTFSRFEMDEMVGSVGAMMQGMKGMISTTFSNTQVEKLLDEEGESILGLATRHFRFRTSYDMEMKILGMRQESKTVREEDIWATTDLTELALGVWLRKEPPKTGDEGLDSMISAQRKDMEGFPLKQETVTTTIDPKGKKQVVRTVMEVTELETATIPDTFFNIGNGYRETELMPGMGGPGRPPFPGQQPPPGHEEIPDEEQYPLHLMGPDGH